MNNYDDLLEEAKSRAQAYRSTAKEYTPKMYDALRHENPNISPEDARDRIEKDCVGIWAKRTILDALPDEAKHREKQEAGRLRQKKHNSAAFSAASAPQQVEEKTKIVVAYVQGKSVEDILLTSDINTNSTSLSEDNTATSNSIQAHLQNQESVSDLKDCSSCQELQAENIELSDALIKATRLTTADQISAKQIEFTIPKAKYEEVKAAIDSSRASVYLTFHKSGVLQRVDPEIWREKLNG